MTQERILGRIKANDAAPIPREKVDEKLEEIRTKYMKVFAILTFMEMDEHIMMLIDAKLDDASLPLVKADVANSRSQCIIAFKDPKRPRPGCFKGWKICFRESFLAYQHRFSPIMLEFQPGTRDVRHVDVDDAAVLPFTQSRAIRYGGFGSVIEVEVDPDCHGFQSALQSIIIDNKFAVKTLLYNSTNEEFRKEVDALKRFNGFVHDHLVTLLMTWTRQKLYSFLFPLAGCNLEDFWIEHSPSVVQNSIHVPTVQWISKQILGLTSAIHTVHNPSSLPDHAKKYGRHGDIRPENVLWYRSPQDPNGILVIADLGLSTLNSEESRSNIPNKGIPFTPGYRPPECDLEGGTISRAYDMWTFGCLLLELVSWALGGNSSRVAFEKARMAPYITGSKSDIFFDVKTHADGPGYVILVKESVSQWICSLHQMSTCTQYFHDLLDLIENGMVVVLSRDVAVSGASSVQGI